MPDWTKKNFQRLRDTSPKDAPMQWKMAPGAVKSPEFGVSRFTYKPGARMPFGHRHKEQEEAYVVVAGSGRAKLDPLSARQLPRGSRTKCSSGSWICRLSGRLREVQGGGRAAEMSVLGDNGEVRACAAPRPQPHQTP